MVRWFHALPELLVTGGVFGGAALAWLAYFRWKDPVQTRSLRFQIVAMGGGVASVMLAAWSYRGVELTGMKIEWSILIDGHFWTATKVAFVAAGLEELAKLLPALAVAFFWRRFNRRSDGILFAACAGIGFATAESLHLWLSGELSLVEGLARAAAAPLTHALFAAPWGATLVSGARQRKPLHLAAGFALSTSTHALYNLTLARGWNSPAQSLGALVVLSLWIWFIRTSSQLRGGAARRLPALAIP